MYPKSENSRRVAQRLGACHPIPPRAIWKEHRSMSVSRKFSSTRPIRQSTAPAARHSRKSSHRPTPEGHRMHGAMPQLSSAAASAAVRRHKLRIVRFRPRPKAHSLRCASSPHESPAGFRGGPDGEPVSLRGIRTDHAQIKWRQTFDPAPCPPRKPLCIKASEFR